MRFWYLLLAIVLFLGGMLFARYLFLPKEKDLEEQSIVLVEKIEKVCKLVTVEGHFVEYYDYGDPPAGPTFIGPFINWQAFLPRKSARLRVQAKVAVGYDLGQLKVEAQNETRTIRISNLPDPRVLYVDHHIDYFDKDESIFRPLTEQDYLDMYKNAEDKIRQAAESSALLETARQQGTDLFDLIRYMVETSGWKLEIAEDLQLKEEEDER